MSSFMKYFQRESSPLDWCEENYVVTSHIAELVNTLSNVFFIFLPPLFMFLHRNYALMINPGIQFIWISLVLIGLCSVYFHTYLSLAGQLLDELSILWTFVIAFCMYVPRRYFPRILRGSRKRLGIIAFWFTGIATSFAVMNPAINSFALMTLGIPAVYMLVMELKRVTSANVKRLGVTCAYLWALSVSVWLLDRLFCPFWLSIGFPYLHGFWHVFICIASCYCNVLFAYFSVKNEKPNLVPILAYWPKENSQFGLPYVRISRFQVFVHHGV